MLYERNLADEQSTLSHDVELPEPIKYLIKNVSDGVVIVDQLGRINYSNKPFQAMVGLSAVDISQLSLSDIDTQYCDQQYPSSFDYLAQSSGNMESRLKFKDNTTLPVQLSSIVTTLSNQPVALVIVKRIIDEKDLEAELREFKSIVDKTTDCVFIFNQDSLTFTYINRGAEKQVGYSLNELEKMHPYDLKPEFNEDEFREFISPLIRNGGGTLNFDTVHQHKNGDLIDVSIVLQLVEGQSGEKQFVAIVRDISDYKKLQEKYRHSQKMEAIGRLAGGVAHDFNNQLAVILGYSDLISHHDISSEVTDYSQRISNAASVSKKLVEQLLTFSRKSDLQLATVDVHELIRETQEFVSHTIEKNITISISLASPLHYVIADKALLKSALLNLILNARDSMENGGHIFIETERLPSAELKPDTFSEAIQITFADNGSGILPEQMPHIFEPFYTTKEQGKGTGLGLSSVKGTIEQHGGTIEVASEVEEGTVVTIILPASPEQHDDVKEACTDAEAVITRGTILLIDDEQQVREVCEDMLDLLGYKVISAASGKEALAVYTKQHQEIALVIVDYMMPDMMGDEVARALQAIQPDVKIMVSSGYLADTTVSDLKRAGVLEVLNKPFSINEFRHALVQHA